MFARRRQGHRDAVETAGGAVALRRQAFGEPIDTAFIGALGRSAPTPSIRCSTSRARRQTLVRFRPTTQARAEASFCAAAAVA